MAAPPPAASAALCDVEALVAAEEGRVSEADLQRYREAVDTALVACEASSPHDRFRLVETAGGNFLLVTNALPGERSAAAAETRAASSDPRSDRDDAFDGVFDEFVAPERERLGGSGGLTSTVPSAPGYAARASAVLSYDGRLLSGSYVVYTKDQLRRSLSPDKRSIVERILRYVDTPGVLDHNNVTDAECLLWLLFCGPRSLCQNPTCFGCDRQCEVPFPALLPPVFYEPVVDYAAYINLAELYVFVWYRDHEFSADSVACYDLGPVAVDRARRTVESVRARFSDKSVPVWPVSSRTCVFCALYNQNRLCLDLAKNDVAVTAYSPIVIRDCREAATNVTLSHVLPGQRAAALSPVYDIGVLLRVLCDSTDGEERRKRVRETLESAIDAADES
ncbi:pR95 [rat cytomegalovirus strain Maastricht]|uniref:PR95 n=1 Tax=Rat cytomegalovirus (strain Maastricht) TaxID=79700 RepID=Q9DWA6_RCMVM|nr:pR95 [rat cytomegalovirus strain Maastricht]AAF99184.1 pR95 [rat cytomegalovirus strain Maastricht]WEG72016.1 protein UL95 [Murid betaherpesvirus 2]